MTTPTVSLYGHWICPFATRVAFALAQRGIVHDEVEVPPSGVRPTGFVLPTEFAEHSPKLEIPMVRIGEDHLADSIPILEWLEVRIEGAPLLPDGDAARDLVRERVAWIDRHAFRGMIGVYYDTEPSLVERAADELRDALVEMDEWLADTDWLAGDEPTLAEAVSIPIYVRLDGLRRLGFSHPLPTRIRRHREQCAQLTGWAAVAWNDAQTDEFVGRLEAFRRKTRATA